MEDAARVQRGHNCLDVIAAEEIAVVIEDELLVIRVATEEGYLQGIGVLRRPRQKAACGYYRPGAARGRSRPLSDWSNSPQDCTIGRSYPRCPKISSSPSALRQ